MHRIYRLTFPSGKSYIGRTSIRLSVRVAQHRYDAVKKHKDQAIHRAIRKYGPKSFVVEVLAKTRTKEVAQQLELRYIKENNSVKNGYNNTYVTVGGGDQWEGRYDSPEYEQFVAKMSWKTSGENNGMFGKKHSTETLRSLREKAEGRYSRPWFVDRYGQNEGVRRYEERCEWLRSRRLPKGKDGKFVSVA